MQATIQQVDPGLEFEPSEIAAPDVTAATAADAEVIPPPGNAELRAMLEWRAWVSDALAQGMSHSEVARHMTAAGWTPAEASALLTVVQQLTAQTLDNAHAFTNQWDATAQPGPTAVPGRDRISPIR